MDQTNAVYPSLRYSQSTRDMFFRFVDKDLYHLFFITREDEEKFQEFVKQLFPDDEDTVLDYIMAYTTYFYWEGPYLDHYNNWCRYMAFYREYCHYIETGIDNELLEIINRVPIDDIYEWQRVNELKITYQHRGRRVDFERVWRDRNSNEISQHAIERIFFSRCVYPNVMHQLSSETIIELAEHRSERMRELKDIYKKNTLEQFFIEEIASIIVKYIPPVYLWPTSIL